MLSCLAKSNQVWAKRAQMLIILVVKNKFDYNGKPNRWAMHDCGLALENLLLEAAAQGLQGHPMAGFSTDAVRETYGVPEDYEPLVAVAVGYVENRSCLRASSETASLTSANACRWTASSSKVNGGSQSKNKAFGGQTYY